MQILKATAVNVSIMYEGDTSSFNSVLFMMEVFCLKMIIIKEQVFMLKKWVERQTLPNPVMVELLPLQKQNRHVEHQ